MMIEYKIKYSYRTGDSFNTSEGEDTLEYVWTDLDVAKEALKRIKEHYKWYDCIESYSRMTKVEKPEWHKVKYEHPNDEHYLINLPLDNKKEVQLRCPWCGYFETLFGAEIVTDDKDMKFEF